MKPALKAGIWPVRAAPIGRVAVGSVLWRHRGQLWCTVVVKSTFGLEPGGLMPRINPSPIRRGDDYLHGLPSLAGAAEIAPQMPQVDVTVVGKAYNKVPSDKRAIRFVLVRGAQVLIDKTLYVYGNRKKGEAPKAFSTMRIGYERALGGLEFPKNPIGVGADRDSSRRPNVVHPKGPKKKVAGYGPIPSRFLQRRQLRGAVSLERMVDGIVDYPDDFDWGYFQAAPKDQRLPRLKGDEWLMLEGMHREHDRIRARLPRARAVCRIFSLKDVGAPSEIELAASMLHIEPEDDRCSMIWRGSFPVVSELASEQLLLAGAVQCGDEEIRWPATIEQLEVMASPPAPTSQITGSQADDLQRTVVSPGAKEHAPQRQLGGGYRLGEQKIQLAAAPPAGPQEMAPAEMVQAAAAQHHQAAPPPLPPPNVPPPPSFSPHGSGAYPAVPQPYPQAPIDPRRPPPPPRRASRPGMQPFAKAPSAVIDRPPEPPSAHGLPSSHAQQVPPGSWAAGAPSTSPGGWGAPVVSAGAPATEPAGTPRAAHPGHPAPERPDFSSTDEMVDPEGEAAADAGLAPHIAPETRRVAIQSFDQTVPIAEPEAEAVEDMEDNPFAFTQVQVDVEDEG